jgi:hypothetical protein
MMDDEIGDYHRVLKRIHELSTVWEKYGPAPSGLKPMYMDTLQVLSHYLKDLEMRARVNSLDRLLLMNTTTLTKLLNLVIEATGLNSSTDNASPSDATQTLAHEVMQHCTRPPKFAEIGRRERAN